LLNSPLNIRHGILWYYTYHVIHYGFAYLHVLNFYKKHFNVSTIYIVQKSQRGDWTPLYHNVHHCFVPLWSIYYNIISTVSSIYNILFCNILNWFLKPQILQRRTPIIFMVVLIFKKKCCIVVIGFT